MNNFNQLKIKNFLNSLSKHILYIIELDKLKINTMIVYDN